jgi:DnaK suppressor protein
VTTPAPISVLTSRYKIFFYRNEFLGRGAWLTQQDIQTIRSKLLNQKSAILNKTKELKIEDSSVGAVGDEAEQAQQNLNTNLTLNFLERDRNSLLMIERALSRLDQNKFGVCDICGDNIGVKRLLVAPFSSLCVDCKLDQEESQNTK